MALDQTSPPSPVAPDLGNHVIDNEVPAYRALAASAIVSLVLGVASIFSFASISFAWLGVGGVLAGVLALRTIRRLPDVYDGAKLAKAGIATSAMFVLSATTMLVTNQFLTERDAQKFARTVMKAMETGDYENILYYMSNEAGRQGRTPAQLAEQMGKEMKNPNMMEQKIDPMKHVAARIKDHDQKLEIVRSRVSMTSDGATAAYEISVAGPPSKEYPEPLQYVALLCRAVYSEGKYHWTLESVVFPTTPKL